MPRGRKKKVQPQETQTEDTISTTAPEAVKVREVPKVVWLIVTFSDHTDWKFPASRVLEHAQKNGVELSASDPESMQRYASEHMTWNDVAMNAVQIVKPEMCNYMTEWKTATMTVSSEK